MSLELSGYIVLIALGILALGIGVVVLLRHLSPAQDSSQPKSDVKVLIVESAPQARATLVKFLGLEPSVVIVGEAATGQSAIAQAKQLQPTAVLLDLTLPDMDGLVVAQAIAKDRPATRFVLTREATAPEPMDLPPGLSAPLVKPLDSKSLVQALHQARRLV